MKKCSKCGIEKSFSDFFKSSGEKSGLHSWCKVCHRACVKRWEIRNHDRWKEIYTEGNKKKQENGSFRAWHLKRKFNITPEEWEALFNRQGRKCPICKRSEIGKEQWHVDHNHETKSIRGILCGPCNRFIVPAVEHYRELIPKVLDYLKQ